MNHKDFMNQSFGNRMLIEDYSPPRREPSGTNNVIGGIAGIGEGKQTGSFISENLNRNLISSPKATASS